MDCSSSFSDVSTEMGSRSRPKIGNSSQEQMASSKNRIEDWFGRAYLTDLGLIRSRLISLSM